MVVSCEPVLRFWSLRGVVFEVFLNLGMARYDLERRMESITGWDESPLVTVSERDAERVREDGEPGRGEEDAYQGHPLDRYSG
jgi:hypothetical protein